MWVHLIGLWCFILGLLFSPTSTWASPCDRELHIAADEFGRYYFFTPDKQPAGIDHELFDEIARRMGCRKIVDIESNIRILRRIEAGTADMAGHKFQTPEREKIAWMVPYIYHRNFAIVRKTAAPVRSKEAFMSNPQLQIAIGRTFSHGPGYAKIVTTLQEQGRVLEVADIKALYNILSLGRVQAIISSAPAYRAMLSAQQLENDFSVEDWVPEDARAPVCLMLSKARFSAEQAQRVSDLIESMRRDGTLKRILEKYLGAEDASQMLFPTGKAK
ncbi:substrate-binding periplasmic protein [Chitinimonas sp. BJB300]|uniref:substrate-binding periplasmic protein n=1 Tax=Chitinimonas sp. BJB300 TaxID=1559339 RepID=UPI000C11FEBA|nr:transporter substrate-binding domain-containing protein [Chitinimonas sp. BJB300]PHV12259.1 hypothetical protein CSQ89_06625 [Chitinimonas sp. BJB300]TSJ84770.1 amino acid ABC transporter substrate-binding protein [Chitinimonas sp. BJB300]